MFGSDIIRVKITGFLKNITENNILCFDEKGIKKNNKISFVKDNIKYDIRYSDLEVFLLRNGSDFINSFSFNKSNGNSSYMIKDNNYTVDMNIKVNKFFVSDNIIDIDYVICDTDCEFNYKLEMREYL